MACLNTPHPRDLGVHHDGPHAPFCCVVVCRYPWVGDEREKFGQVLLHPLSTTSLVTPRPEGSELLRGDQPADEILQQQDKHEAVQVGQGAVCG